MVKQGYKQTEIGVIPEDWDIKCAKSFGDIITGSTPSMGNEQFWNGDTPWITPSDIQEARDIAKSERMITKEGLSAIRELPPSTLLVTCIASIGKNAVLTKKGACNQQINAIIPSNKYSVNYLYYLMEINKEYLLANSGITATRIVSKNDFAKLKFAVSTNKKEQNRIAEALSDVDSMISSLEKLIAKKKAIKQGAMQELLTGKKRLPGFTGKWFSGKWKDVLECFSSGATPYRGNSEFYKGTIKWVSSGELNYNYIMDTLEHISYDAQTKTNLTLHPAGTFLMAITGLEAAGTRGSCAILGSAATTNQSCMAIYGTEKMSTEYLFHYYVQNGNELAIQYCQGTKQQSYTAAIVKELPIYYPKDVAEQAAIASVLSDMDNEIEALERKLEKTRQIKQGMMQQLLTGKIRLV